MSGNGARVAVLLSLAVLALTILPCTPGRAADAPPNAVSSESGPHPASYVPFAPNVRVNAGTLGYNHQVEPTMAINSQGRIFVGWKEALTSAGGGQRVGFAYSMDGGNTFSPNILMPLATLAHQSDPWLTVTSDDRVYFTRIEYDSPAAPGGIAVTNTTDGATWGTTYYRSDAPNFADKESAAHDAAGNLYWVWNSDVIGGRQDLAFSRSDDGGATWTSKVLVSGPGTLGGIVQVAPNGTVVATWWSYISMNVMFDRSFDGGRTWGPDIRVNDLPGSADSPLPTDPPVLPAMAVAPNGTIYVVAEDYRNGWPSGTPNGDMDIYFYRSSNGGSTWTPGVRLNDDATTARQWMPDLALDPFGGVHVAWMDDRTGNHNVFYVNSTDGGTTWGPNVRVADAETSIAYSRPGDYLAIESDPAGTICVVWTDGRGADLDIYFAKLPRSVLYTVMTDPAGLDVVVDGASATAPASFAWIPGSVHSVSAPSPQATGPQSQEVFVSWSDGGGPAHLITASERGGTFLSTFAAEYQVTLRTSPVALDLLVDGSLFTGSVGQWWREGAPHRIEAPGPQTVDAGTRYTFAAWSDGGAAAHDASVTGPWTFDASFTEQFLLQVLSPHGTPVGGGWYNASETALFSIEATAPGSPGTRYAFARWAGDSAAVTSAATIGMDGPKTVTATWTIEYLLTVDSPYGTPVGGGWYEAGMPAAAGVPDRVTVGGTTYRFAGWSGDSSETSSTVLVTMNGPKTLTATWQVVPPPGPPSSAADLLPWIAVVIVLAVIGSLVVFVAWHRRRKDDDSRPPPPPV